ncbi:MAG TPA: 4-aminobutyrate--2-oxoglutarate transaminase [Chloroflexota bacterium]|nr:4-aminobutyrate--2-oxoglutarate transaminase [Chloroflexota bacterium]
MHTDTETKTAIWTERRRAFVPRGVATYDPIVVDHAHGAEVWDVDGRRYIDFAAGIGTLNVGHTPSRVVDAIQQEATRLLHMCFSVSYYPPYIELAERLAAAAPGDGAKKTLLVNSGAEAVENAVKIARVATGRPAIIAFENAFHGRTSMAMALTGKERPYKAGFGPFAPDVHHARYPYRYRCECADPARCSVESGEDLDRLFATTVVPESVAAIIVEPVQGEGGFIVAPPEWLRTLRRICDREGILLIADEVQTGFGRTGRMWAMEHAGVEPDLMVLAKSIAAGLPLGAVVGRADLMDAPGPGGIGGTFGGNPLACVAALVVLDMFEEQDLVARAGMIGQTIAGRLSAMAARYALIGEARGLGAMQAIELVTDERTREPAKRETALVLERCLERGLIVLKAGLYDNVVRILAPLVIEEALIEEGLDILEAAIADLSP